MAETMNDLDESEMQRLDYFWNWKTSYLLDSFNLNNPDMTENLAIIVITIFVLTTMCYVAMLLKLKK